LNLARHWPLFESGATKSFATAIALDIVHALKQQRFSCVVLAQASMAGAAKVLDRKIPVLASPESAVQALLTSPQPHH
jgi:hypothetical protein